MTIGESIKKIRAEKGMTQKQLGDLLGVSMQTVSSYEAGKRRPKMETLARFAEALGVSVQELIAEVDYLPNEEHPERGFIPAHSELSLRALVMMADRLKESGSEEEREELKQRLEMKISDIQDTAILSVFRTLSDLNKQKAISYCEGLAATQPEYEFSDTAIVPAENLSGENSDCAEGDLEAPQALDPTEE